MTIELQSFIEQLLPSLTPVEAAVLTVIRDASMDGNKVTQLDIARSQPFLGCHPVHEQHVQCKMDSTTRQIRQQVLNLRRKWEVPILANRDGYWLPHSQAECDEYIAQLGRVAEARSRSSLKTYDVMCRMLRGTKDKFFELLRQIHGQPDLFDGPSTGGPTP